VLNGWRTVPRKRVGPRVRLGALVVGAVAALTMGVVGCTSIIGGTATVDTSAAPPYRSSVSASVSASAATSSKRESQRQQSLTTQVVRGACGKFAATSTDAVDTVNKYVEAFNGGGDISGTAGPAVEALNHSADTVAGTNKEPLSAELHATFDSYVDAARAVANAISSRAPASVYNSRKDQLNSVREKGLQLCRTY
jgi:cytoskeletal protein RodZ